METMREGSVVSKTDREAERILGTIQTWSCQNICIGFQNLSKNNAKTPVNTKWLTKEMCRMILCLSGDMKVCILRPHHHQHFVVPAGWCSLHYYGTCRCMDQALDEHARAIQLTVPCTGLLQLLGEGRLQRQLTDAHQNVRSLAIDQPITPAMHLLIEEMKDTMKHTHACCGPFVIGKGMELLSVFSHCWDTNGESPMFDQDRKAVEKACHILEKDLVEPPSLGDLASQVGMSLSKFKQVFRRSCDMPPYAYLRKARMEKAMCMLRLHGARVTETALEVGYNSLSHFAKAFASYFGVSPSEVRKRSVPSEVRFGRNRFFLGLDR